jgi:hypothetical protein
MPIKAASAHTMNTHTGVELSSGEANNFLLLLGIKPQLLVVQSVAWSLY